jgi:uncharacterized protein (DUF952 family)
VSHVVHALTETEWDRFRETGEHRPDSLDEEGFVHCPKPGQMVVVADTVHADDAPMRLLVIDESRLDASVQYGTNDDGASPFPHVYGPLTLDAVVEAFPFDRDETGYRLPEELLAV